MGVQALLIDNPEPDTFWVWVETIMMWRKIAHLLQAGTPEMDMQWELAERLIVDYANTGTLTIAKEHHPSLLDGLDYMEAIAELTDVVSANKAADQSELEMKVLLHKFENNNLTPTIQKDTNGYPTRT